MTTIIILVGFAIIVLAARQVGQLFARLRLPLITGYLFTGIIAGHFILDFITTEAVHSLHFIEQLSLAFIAFAAGSELYLKELRSRLKSIAWVTIGLVVFTHLLGSAAIFLLANQIPFMQGLPLAGRLAAALLGGAIMVARSPSSAIAIVNEMRAKGMFTSTILGVTVVMDLVVIVIFSIDSSLAETLLTSESPSPTFVLLLVGEILLALALGYGVGKILELLLRIPIDQRFRTLLILLLGYSIFVFSGLLREVTHDNLSFEVFVEPLLICVLASLYVTNRTVYRDEFSKLLHDAGLPIYAMFFTLTGASLSLDIFLATWPIALMLFGVRVLGIIGGSFAGGMIAGDPVRLNRILWMGFITQAGVALGLSREVAAEFPIFGDAFATMIISIIVVNETVGPILFKMAIRRSGESHLQAQADPDAIRDAVILGVGGQAQALARQLIAYNWQVILADTDPEHVEHNDSNSEFEVRLLPTISHEALSSVVTSSTDALVVMLDDDSANLTACELAYEHYGVPRLVAQLNDYSMADRFRELGVQVVYPASAMVNLLDQSVRAPQTAALLMHEDAGNETVQITITNPDINNLRLRDLRLPVDVLVLGIARDGTSIMPHGHTVMKFNDEVTLIGSPSSLDDVTLRLGF